MMCTEEEKLHDFLSEIQLEQFYYLIVRNLHLTRIAHFDHVEEIDLTGIGMSKPEQRRLFDHLKKYKKPSIKKFFKKSFKRESDKRPSSSSPPKDKDLSLDAPSNEQPPINDPVLIARNNIQQGLKCLIQQKDLCLGEFLGKGAFGYVRKGVWTTEKGSELNVAVKCLKPSHDEATILLQGEFIKEANAMNKLDHPNLIRLYGIVLTTPMMLVTELAPVGSLLNRLRREPEKFMISILCSFVVQIVSGMRYLETNRFIHRDLAARNILLVSYEKIKIGDFGLMRALPSDADYYVMQPNGLVPFAWCATECLKYRRFSHASDVWAFGVTVLEIFSYGQEPWPGLNGAEILERIDAPNFQRPERPQHCPMEIYRIMKNHCWNDSAEERASFEVLEKMILEVLPKEMNASRDYYTENNGEIGFKTGDPLTIIEASQDAAFVKAQNRRNGKVGFIPLSTLSTSPPNLKSTATDLKIIQTSVRSKSNSRSLSLNRGKLLEPDCMSLSSRASSTSSSSNSSTESGPNRSSRHIVHSNPKDIPSRRQSTFSSSGFGSSGPSCTSSFKEDMIRGTSESEYGSNDDSSFLFSRKSSATRSIIAEDRLSCSTYENTNEDLRERSPYENTPSSPPEDTVSPPLHSNPIAIPKSPKHMGASLRVPLGQSPPPTTGYMNPSPPRATFVDPSHVISLPNNVNHKQSNLVVVLNTSSESEAEQGLSNSAPTTKGEMKAAKVTKRKQRVERTEELSHRASFGSYKQKSQKTGSSTAAPFVDNAVYECMSMNENSTVNYELMEDNATVDRCNDRENYEDRSQRTNVRAEQDTSSCYENVSLSSPKDESVVIRTPPLPPKMTRSVYNRMSLPPRTYRKISDESTTETHNITRDDMRKRASTTPPPRTFGKSEEPPIFRRPDKALHDVYENMAILPSRTYRKTAEIPPVMSVPPRTYKSSNESYENVGPTEIWKPSSSDLSYENFNFNRSSSSGKYRSDSMYEERMISEQKDAFSFNGLRISSGERHSSANERAFSPNERAFSPNERALSSTEQVFLGKFSPDALYENHDLRTAVDTPPPLPRKRSSRTECEMSILPDQEFRSSSSLRMEQAIYENQEIKSYEGRDLHLDISDTRQLNNERLADGERNLIDDSPIHKDLPSRYGTIWDGKEIIQESESIEAVADFGEESGTSPNVTCEKLIPEITNAKATADIEVAKDSLLSKPGKAMQQETIDQEHSSMLRALLSPKEQRSPRLDRAQSEETPIRPPRRHRKKSQSRRHTVGTLKLQERPAESSEAAFPRKPYDSAQKESIVEKLKASCPTENDPTAPPLPPREMHEACFQRQLSDFVQIETSDLECEAVEETEIKELEPPEAFSDDAKARNLQELEKADSFPEEIVIEETLEIKEKQEVAEKLETEVTKSASKPETGKSRLSKIKSLLSGKVSSIEDVSNQAHPGPSSSSSPSPPSAPGSPEVNVKIEDETDNEEMRYVLHFVTPV